MKELIYSCKILFITTFPPKKCGIASFSKDLIDAIDLSYNKSFDIWVCALDNEENSILYEKTDVKMILDIEKIESIKSVVNTINNTKLIKLVHIEHEFGLYSQINGNSNMLYFLSIIRKPFTVRFHTIFNGPHKAICQLINVICSKAHKILVMTNHSAKLLEFFYKIPSEKICIIPHGTHFVEKKDKSLLVQKSNLKNRIILITFGFISQYKGLEIGIDAMVNISKSFPEAIYLIIGIVHPANDLMLPQREKYFISLQQKVASLGLSEKVKFINEYLSTSELFDYLAIADIYLFTSIVKDQVMSGTFLYAMNAGCPIVSTPFALAKEMLDAETGIVLKSADAVEMSEKVIYLLKHNSLRKKLGYKAFIKTRENLWENVALKHCKFFSGILKTKIRTTVIPEINLSYIYKTTDTFGILREEVEDCNCRNYSLGENAKALIAFVGLYELEQKMIYLEFISIYLSFILDFQQKDGTFSVRKPYPVNFILAKVDSKYSEMIIVALACILQTKILPDNICEKAENAFLKYIKSYKKPISLMNKALHVKALYLFYSGNENIKLSSLFFKYSNEILSNYNNCNNNSWAGIDAYFPVPWLVPQVLFYAFCINKEYEFKEKAEECLNFLIEYTCRNNYFQPLNDNFWNNQLNNDEIELQTGEVLSCIEALKAAFDATGNKEYIKKSYFVFNWFLGDNRLNQVVYNKFIGSSHIGLDQKYINKTVNTGASLNYLLSRIIIDKIKPPVVR